jgi:hypothetical protein
MREVSIRQLWSRAWALFKGNWLLLVGLLVLYIIANLIFFILIPYIGNLIASLLVWPALVRAGYLVARQGQLSSGEVFGDISLLLKVFVYDLILRLIPGILIVVGYTMVMGSAVAGLSEAYTEDGYGGMSGSMALSGAGDILLWVGPILLFLFILYFFGWAGPYAILSGRAGIFSAIGQSFSLTWRNFGKVFVALLSVIGLLILGLLPLRLGLLMEVPILILGGVLLYGLWLLVVGPMTYVFQPLLYFALTGEEGASHA